MLFWNYIREEEQGRRQIQIIYIRKAISSTFLSPTFLSLRAFVFFFKIFSPKNIENRKNKTKQNNWEEKIERKEIVRDREEIILGFGDSVEHWRYPSFYTWRCYDLSLSLCFVSSDCFQVQCFMELMIFELPFSLIKIGSLFFFFCFGRSDSIGFTLVDHLFFWCFGLQIWIFFLCLGIKWWFWADKCCECFKTVFCSYDLDSVYRLTSSNLSWISDKLSVSTWLN